MPHESRAPDDDAYLACDAPGNAAVEVRPPADGVLLAYVSGDLDCFVTAYVRRRLVEHVDASVNVLVVDLAGVTLMSAAAIGMLLEVVALSEDHGVEVRVVAAHRSVLRPLRLTSVDEQLRLFASTALAMKAQ